MSDIINTTTGWRTLFDVDFTAQPNQTLSPDGDYTIAGLTWTKINSAGDAAAMAIVNGTGLVIQPAAATQYVTGTRTLPALTIKICGLAPAFNWTSQLRLWLRIADDNITTNYDSVCIAQDVMDFYTYNTTFKVATGPGPVLAWFARPVSNGVSLGDLSGAWTAGEDVIGLYNTAALGAMAFTGTYGAGWPNPNSITVCATRQDAENAYVQGRFISTPLNCVVLIGAARFGSATALRVVVSHAKAEYIL